MHESEDLANDPWFIKFLNYVELDHFKFFPEETQSQIKLPTKIGKLELKDFAKYSYILGRRLEREEEFRLQTEEQYQVILEKQMMAHQQIEQRAKILKDKLGAMLEAKGEAEDKDIWKGFNV